MNITTPHYPVFYLAFAAATCIALTFSPSAFAETPSSATSSSSDSGDAPLRLNVELDLVQPVFGGVGGTIGLEKGHLGAGAMGFVTPLSSQGRDLILSGADSLDVTNWGAEVWGDYYFDEDHRGLFVGGLISLDGYIAENSAMASETIHALYVVPRVGYRLSHPTKWTDLYLQAALIAPIRVWDDASDFSGQEVGVNNILLLPLLTVGIRI